MFLRLPAVLALATALATALALGFTGCATREPGNLDRAKSAVRRYHDSGAYDRDLAAVAASART